MEEQTGLPYQVQAEVKADKKAPLDNPLAQKDTAMSTESARARRNALVRELFRVVPQVHPPKPKVQNIPKSSTMVVEKQDVSVPGDSTEAMHAIHGVHLDVYDYFSIPVESVDADTLEKLQYINSFVNSKGSFEDGMRALFAADRKLGVADAGQTKLSKIYNWLRFSRGKQWVRLD